MNKAMVILLAAVFAAAGLTTQKATAQEKQEKKEKTAAAAKETRWHGTLVRINKDQSTLDVRRGRFERRIYYDSSTKWTEGKKALEMSEFKDGADVICLEAIAKPRMGPVKRFVFNGRNPVLQLLLGKYDEKGEFHATRIDLHHR